MAYAAKIKRRMYGEAMIRSLREQRAMRTKAEVLDGGPADCEGAVMAGGGLDPDSPEADVMDASVRRNSFLVPADYEG